jgi:hypothetical protein
MLNLNVSTSDFALIHAISKRALALLKGPSSAKAHIEMEMDLEAVHNCCPLRLAAWLGTNDFDFVHEIVGLREHFDQKTGHLDYSFWPHFAAHILPCELCWARNGCNHPARDLPRKP